jgi:dTDP-4-amino-4,6-dideoxygalactose transaminase
MLAGDDAMLIERARHFSTQARAPAPHNEHSEIGFNYRMSNLLAALGRAQVEGLPAKVARRRAINAAYRAALADVHDIGFLPNAPDGEPTNWLTVVTLDDPTPVREHLETLDIEARPAWKPMHLQPVFADCEMRGGAVAEAIFRRGLCLPSGSSMTDADIARVVDGVRQVVASA